MIRREVRSGTFGDLKKKKENDEELRVLPLCVLELRDTKLVVSTVKVYKSKNSTRSYSFYVPNVVHEAYGGDHETADLSELRAEMMHSFRNIYEIYIRSKEA